MGDQTKSIQNLSTERSIEHKKHNQLDIKIITSTVLRNPQQGCLASHYKKTLNNNEITKPRYLCKSCSSCCLQSSFPEIGTMVSVEFCALGIIKFCVP